MSKLYIKTRKVSGDRSELIERVNTYLERAAKVEDQMLIDAEDALDSQIARERLDEIEASTMELVTDAALDARLSAILDE